MINRIGIQELDIAAGFRKSGRLVPESRHPCNCPDIFKVVDDVEVSRTIRDVGDVDAVSVVDA